MSKIYLELRSGLGNQLFQFSFGYSLARQFDKELILCPAYFDSPLKFFVKKALGREARSFRLPLLVASSFKVMPQNYWRELSKHNNIRLIDEAAPEANFMEVCAGDNDVYIKGYWQNEKYFSQFKDELSHLFSPNFNKSDKYKTTLKNLTDSVVGIHVRRGDFLRNKAFGACTIDYYIKGINEIKKSVGEPSFLVFTNNVKWVKENFPSNISYQIYSEDNPNADVEEMFLMSKMRNLIISNSTFSWWSAYLNHHPGSLIVCPERWHLSEKLEQKTASLMPDNWRKISNSLELQP